MSGIVPYAIWAGIILAALGILAMAIFGIRSLFYGKLDPLSIVLIGIPALVLLVLGLTMDSWARAGILTVIVTFGLAIVGLLVTGVRGLFT